jgi:two-component system response regulator HydG
MVYAVPPLRDCPEDLESLALLALDRASQRLGKNVPGLAPAALTALREHDFPFNQHELELVIERAVALTTGLRVEPSDLPALPRGNLRVGSFIEQEREILRRALDTAGGNRTRAARALGLKRTTLIEKLRKLGLDEGRSGTTTEH